MKSTWLVRVASIALALAVAGCTIDPYTGEKKTSNTAKGAGIGALAGAAIGAATAGKDKNKAIKQGNWSGDRFNAMIAPFATGPMQLAGAIWYQGESSNGEGRRSRCTPVAARRWRRRGASSVLSYDLSEL